MNTYDPERPPPPKLWLEADEAERIDWVAAYHRRNEITVPNAQLHALVHVVIENQIALGEEEVVKTMARLRTEGLSRHDALHAIGSVLAEHMYELMQPDQKAVEDANRRYAAKLEQLTARGWKNG